MPSLFPQLEQFFPFKGKMILSVFSLIMSFALLITQSCGTVSSVALNQYLNAVDLNLQRFKIP